MFTTFINKALLFSTLIQNSAREKRRYTVSTESNIAIFDVIQSDVYYIRKCIRLYSTVKRRKKVGEQNIASFTAFVRFKISKQLKSNSNQIHTFRLHYSDMSRITRKCLPDCPTTEDTDT